MLQSIVPEAESDKKENTDKSCGKDDVAGRRTGEKNLRGKGCDKTYREDIQKNQTDAAIKNSGGITRDAEDVFQESSNAGGIDGPKRG